MRLSSVVFFGGVRLHPFVKTRFGSSDRCIPASSDLTLELNDDGTILVRSPAGARVFGSSSWESYEPMDGCFCVICHKSLDPKSKGQTCSKSCSAKLRHSREKATVDDAAPDDSVHGLLLSHATAICSPLERTAAAEPNATTTPSVGRV
jgi:hypothetical protein